MSLHIIIIKIGKDRSYHHHTQYLLSKSAGGRKLVAREFREEKNYSFTPQISIEANFDIIDVAIFRKLETPLANSSVLHGLSMIRVN
jgi:hypothetical protein